MPQPLAVVLAAGKGTRMKTDLPKVLVAACGRPLIDHVLDALERAGIERQVIVVGYRADDVKSALASRRGVDFALQTEQLGTGHAVQMARPQLEKHDGPVLIVTGDSPLVQPASLRELLAEFERTRPACLLGTLHKEHPQGLGRIVRDAAGEFAAIVEERDATDEQRRITEVNMSTYLFDAGELLWALDRLTNTNRQREYYLTDCPGLLRGAGRQVRALPILRPCEALSVNTFDELAAVEAELERQSSPPTSGVSATSDTGERTDVPRP
jgi:bifunctional UDP-N-acetylglucosamine pyrophosphorylase / glucosamine-1-phosphate N-acetyltransferase